jgi:phosphoglucomutase
MKMAIELAKKTGADLVFGTDPDADRMGAAVRDNDGSYRMLTGNQIACILIEYLLEKRKQDGCLKSTDYIIKSFVSTTMADAIAKHYGIVCHTVLTGFRFISEIITESENTDAEFIFGFEESYGFLAGTFTRDKDGALGALLLCKAAQHYLTQGKSLLEVLHVLYQKYGYYAEGVKNMVFKGLDGMEKMTAIMTGLRGKPISQIGGKKVLYTEDYQSGLRTDAEGKTEPLTLPKSNALRFLMEDGAWACIRPSGTEPKIKAYYAACADDQERAKKQLADIASYFDNMI